MKITSVTGLTLKRFIKVKVKVKGIDTYAQFIERRLVQNS